jgi:hypothetical protein
MLDPKRMSRSTAHLKQPFVKNREMQACISCNISTGQSFPCLGIVDTAEAGHVAAWAKILRDDPEDIDSDRRRTLFFTEQRYREDSAGSGHSASMCAAATLASRRSVLSHAAWA